MVEFGQNITVAPITKLHDDVELNEFFKKHLNNCSEYLANRIESEKNRNIFLDTIEVINTSLYFENLEDLSIFLEEKTLFLKDEYTGWWGWKRNVEYQYKAYLVAQDVCDSLLKRFVTGGEGESYFYKNR